MGGMAARKTAHVPKVTSPRSTRIITCANHKGGTGKTTTAVNVSAGLALLTQQRVLLQAIRDATLEQRIIVNLKRHPEEPHTEHGCERHAQPGGETQHDDRPGEEGEGHQTNTSPIGDHAYGRKADRAEDAPHPHSAHEHATDFGALG